MSKRIDYPVLNQELTDTQKEELINSLLQFINTEGLQLENHLVNFIDINELAAEAAMTSEDYTVDDMERMHRTVDGAIHMIEAIFNVLDREQNPISEAFSTNEVE